MDRKEKRNYFILYSITFLAMIAMMFSGQLIETGAVNTGKTAALRL